MEFGIIVVVDRDIGRALDAIVKVQRKTDENGSRKPDGWRGLHRRPD